MRRNQISWLVPGFLVATLTYAAEPVPRIPVIEVRDFGTGFVPANLANGFIGIRPGANPLVAITGLPGDARAVGHHPLATVVAGFVRSHPAFGIESWAPAPYPLATELRVGGSSLQSAGANLRIIRQSLDMSDGELSTEMTFSPGAELDVALRVLQFASRTVPSLLCQELQITPSADASIEIETLIDHAGIPGEVYRDHAPYQQEQTDRVLGWRTDRSKLGIALAVPPDPAFVRKAVGHYSLEAKAGRTYTFHTFAAMVSQAYHPDPDLQAIRVARWGQMLGFQQVREANRESWRDLWRSRIKVYGDAEAQKALDTAFFYLHSSANPSARTGVPPFGFSQYEAYEGHIFWDMDSWMFPAVLLANPAAAKAMLEFRLHGLDAASEKAASFGFSGAQFPWEAATDGSEACPPAADTGWGEQHIVPDVALAFWEYQLATGDREFLRRGTWPVLRNVAEWIESRGRFTARGFEIGNMMGVDESLGNVANSSHMNLACKLAVQAAVGCARKVGLEPPPNWDRIAREMVIPLDSSGKVVIPYDGASPGPGYSVGMLQFLMLHGLPIAPELFRSTYEFEERLRARNPATPSNPCSTEAPGFSCPPFSAAAAFFGDPHKAAELFRNSWQPYSAAPYGLSKEYRKYADGNYITNFGSLLMTAMLGFTGLRIGEGDWREYPATLPEGWQRIEIDRIWIQGKPMKLVAENGKRAVLTGSQE